MALEAAEKIPEGEIFIIPVRLDDCSVPDSLAKWHWIDIFVPREFNKIVSSLKAKFVPITANLVIINDSSRMMAFTLEKNKNSIGRKDSDRNIYPDIDLSFIDTEGRVSRRHARIVRQGDLFYVEDLNSSNGTFINNSQKLDPHVSYPLNSGDVLQLADISLRFITGVGGRNTVATKSYKTDSRSTEGKQR